MKQRSTASSRPYVIEPMAEPSEHDNVLFPNPYEITAHAIAFAQMMFRHSSFELEVSLLQDAITKEEGFGEQRVNQWGARERPERKVDREISR